MNERAEKRIANLLSSVARKPREHGKRVSYILGCRCLQCRVANAKHSTARLFRRAQGEADILVDPSRARKRIRWLSRNGVGRKAVAKASGVNHNIIAEIISRERPHIRLSTERRILAVDTRARADHALIDAAPTWKILNRLIEDGYTKAQISTWLQGRPTRSLQIRRKFVQAGTARAVELLAARIDRGQMQREFHIEIRERETYEREMARDKERES